MKNPNDDNNEENLPIDIHTSKLLEWLISRRHCDRNWPKQIQEIREKINNAIQDMPAVDEITNLLSGTYINYFHCLRIVKLLKETEVSSKNIFGYYSSQRMKDWQEIVKLYEKNNIYLADAAQMLMRNVSYEVPSLRKQVTKCKQVQEESSKKQIDFSKNAATFRDQYQVTCHQIGIKGENVKNELLELLKDLPKIYDGISDSCKNLRGAVEFHNDYLKYTMKSDDASKNHLPTLLHIINKGNTTTYQYKYGEEPLSIEEVRYDSLVKDDIVEDDDIDFGDDIDFPASNDNASTDDSNGWKIVEMPKQGEIDFGDESEVNYTDQIDFGVVSSSDLGITLEGSGTDGGIAKGDEALSVLDNNETRTEFENELLRLEAFLDSRSAEMKVEGDILAINQFQDAPSNVQRQTVSTIKSMSDIIGVIVSELNSSKMLHLNLIGSSPTYVDRLTESLKRKLKLSDKAEAAKVTAADRQSKAHEEQQLLLPKIDLIIEKTKELQKQIEVDISKRYKNRPVNLMGGVKTL